MENNIIEDLYSTKEINYFSLEREIFKKEVTGKDLNILDIGCGIGALGAHYKASQNCKVYGIEISPNAFKLASECLDGAVKGNVENMKLEYENNFFDVMILGDVLEHLINPLETIKRLLPFLKVGGQIYISVPNVRHWSVVFALIFKDEWKYEEWGILDYTHMRFFTRNSIARIFMDIRELEIVKNERVIQSPSKSYSFNLLTMGFFSGFLASHTFITLKKVK